MTILWGFATPVVAYSRPGRTERMGGSNSFYPSVSGDGRYVAFHSFASNLVPGDTNGASDVFVRDRETGATEQVSVASDGSQGNVGSFYPSVSGDGRYVAFESAASNLVPGDTNGAADVFVHDRQTGATERVSVTSEGGQANGDSSSLPVSIIADGRHVAFASMASNLVPGDTNGYPDVFVHDRDTGITERMSVTSDGSQGNFSAYYPSISVGGRFVAFESEASNLVPGDTNGVYDVFVHDRQIGTTERVSVASDGSQGNVTSSSPSLSADGRYVAFKSLASNLVPGDTNGTYDVFVHDRQTGATDRVSVASDGAERSSGSGSPSISASGRYVAFESFASDLDNVGSLLAGSGTGTRNVFVHDRDTGITELVSVTGDGAAGNADSYISSISADGRYVAFYSLASNLVSGDAPNTYDVFVRDRGRPVGVGELTAAQQEGGIPMSGWATFSGAVMASAADPPDDGAPGAGLAGAELTGARLTYRPEAEDLLLRFDLASLPGPHWGGAPAVLYGLDLTAAGTDFEVRAFRAAATSLPPAAPYFALYRCDPDCTEQAVLSGGIGTTGNEVVVTVELAPLGVQEGEALGGIHAFAALGEAATGAVETLDEVDLPNTLIPTREVSLGIAPAGSPEQNVDFTSPAALQDGSFSGTLDDGSFSSGNYDVWARACLGDVCGATSTPISLQQIGAPMTNEAEGSGMGVRVREGGWPSARARKTR